MNTPWEAKGYLIFSGLKLVTEIPCQGISQKEREEIASQIVRAVNNYDAMKKFIEAITDAAGPYKYLNGKSIVADAYEILRQASGE